jgi:hypothetical protein
MSESTGPTAIGEVRSAAQVLKDDVMCQSFIQGSSTLAYVCLLIRKGQYELAGHVLRQLESRKSGRFRDIVFYIQTQIDMELGLFDIVKVRLIERLREHPADMVALSLLQACIQAELLVHEGEKQPEPNPVTSADIEHAIDVLSERREAEAIPFVSQAMPGPSGISIPDPELPASYPHLRDLLDIPPVEPSPEPAPVAVEPPPPPILAPKTLKTPIQASATAEVELIPFQAVIQDPGTLGFIVWETRKGTYRKEVKDPGMDALVTELPQWYPGHLSEHVQALDSGKMTKTCFAFGKLTVTTLHHGHFHCGLVTGPLSQSLIAVVRTETLFAKRAHQLRQAGEFDGEA